MKMCEDQMSLFDSLSATDQIYSVGDIVYYVILDNVKKCTVEGTFECKNYDDLFSGPTCRYHSTLEGGGGHTFGKYDIGETIFDTRKDAVAKGQLNLVEFGVSVIRAEAIVPDEFVAYEEVEAMEHYTHRQYGCCALVGGTMVYRMGPYTYNFLDSYGDEKTARRAYKKASAKLKRDFSDREAIQAGFKAKDCYGAGDGHWAACDYAYNNWFGGLMRRP